MLINKGDIFDILNIKHEIEIYFIPLFLNFPEVLWTTMFEQQTRGGIFLNSLFCIHSGGQKQVQLYPSASSMLTCTTSNRCAYLYSL